MLEPERQFDSASTACCHSHSTNEASTTKSFCHIYIFYNKKIKSLEKRLGKEMLGFGAFGIVAARLRVSLLQFCPAGVLLSDEDGQNQWS